MFKRKNETVLWTENVERVKCYGGQERIEFQDSATSKQILQRKQGE